MPSEPPQPQLQATLAQLLEQLPQASSVALMGFDGLAVQVCEVEPSGEALPAALSTYAQALTHLAQSTADAPCCGAPDALVVHAAAGTVILKPLHREHYLAVVQAPQAPVGRALCYMDLAMPSLLAEL